MTNILNQNDPVPHTLPTSRPPVDRSNLIRLDHTPHWFGLGERTHHLGGDGILPPPTWRRCTLLVGEEMDPPTRYRYPLPHRDGWASLDRTSRENHQHGLSVRGNGKQVFSGMREAQKMGEMATAFLPPSVVPHVTRLISPRLTNRLDNVPLNYVPTQR
jgi:hypothetical protein